MKRLNLIGLIGALPFLFLWACIMYRPRMALLMLAETVSDLRSEWVDEKKGNSK
jgi:hypothetical protein